KINLHLDCVELADVVATAVETSQPLIEARRHELTVTLPEAPLSLRADLTRLAQVLANLLNNAAKYTEEGGHIWLAATREGQTAVISVRDNGMGISSEVRASIFEPFSQATRSLDRAQGGLGVGLTLVRRLVEMHSGTVQAFSAGPNQGSEFIVRLPVI